MARGSRKLVPAGSMIAMIALSALLAAGAAVPAAVAQQDGTADPPPPGGAEAVEALAAEGVLDGTSCAPGACDDPVARWEVAVWMVRILGLDPIPHDSFSDIDPDRHPADHVEALYDAGITAGCALEPLRFCPDRPATRDEAATFVARAFGLVATDTAQGFSDVAADSVHAQNVAALRSSGIGPVHCGDDDARFCPRAPVAGAVAAEWLHRASLLTASADTTTTTTPPPTTTPSIPPGPTVTAPPPPPPPTTPPPPPPTTAPSTSTGGQQFGQADCPHIEVTQDTWADGIATMGTITIADGLDMVQIQAGKVKTGDRGGDDAWLEFSGSTSISNFGRFLASPDYAARLKEEGFTRGTVWDLRSILNLSADPPTSTTMITFGTSGGIDAQWHSGSGWITVTPVEPQQDGNRLVLSGRWPPTPVAEPCLFALMRPADRQPLP